MDSDRVESLLVEVPLKFIHSRSVIVNIQGDKLDCMSALTTCHAVSQPVPINAMTADGEKRNFDGVFEAHFSDVFNFLKYLTRDIDEAEDLCQETFLRFYRKYGSKDLAQITNCRALLIRIAKNLFLNDKRRKGKFVAMAEGKVDSLPDKAADFVSDYDWNAYIVETCATLRAKKEIYAVIFVLRVVQGYDFEEIAKICRKTTRTIRRHMQNIKQIVKKFA